MKYFLVILILFALGIFYSRVIVRDSQSVSQEMIECADRTLAGWAEPGERLFLVLGRYVKTGMISQDTIAVTAITLWNIPIQKLAVTCDRGVADISN